jgi:hypothetical protein
MPREPLLRAAVRLLNPVRWPEPFSVGDDRGPGLDFTASTKSTGHRCRKAAEERFTAHRMDADHLALYRRVIAQPMRLPYRRARDRVTQLHIVGPSTGSTDVTQLR